MLVLKVSAFILTCTICITLTNCACQKSFVTVCDSLSDVQYNAKKNTWTELLIQKKSYVETLPRYTLTSKQLGRELSNLKWLIINEQLSRIESDSFTYCKNLQQLILYGNDVKIIPRKTFVGFRNLMKLGLENNNIEQMHADTFVLSKIEVVDLSYNKVQVLTAGLFKKCVVTTVRATHNRLWKIDSNSLPRDLKFLHLDHNSLDSLPQELNNLNKLQELTISHNNLYNAPQFSELRGLTKLDLSFNKISSVSYEFNNVINLRHLDLSSNHIEKFTFTSAFIQNMKNSNKDQFFLQLAHNNLRNLDLEPLRSKDVTVTLSGNPWNCKCMDKMQEVIKRNNIMQTSCDHAIFSSGEYPYCISDDSQRCSEERVVDSILEEYRSTFKDKICDVFSDTEVFVQ